jgi:hypothetical protein
LNAVRPKNATNAFWRKPFARAGVTTVQKLMNTLLDFAIYAGLLVAASAVGGVCLIGLIVWLAGGEPHDSPETNE